MGAKDKKQDVSDQSSEEEFDGDDEEVLFLVIQDGHSRISHQKDQGTTLTQGQGHNHRSQQSPAKEAINR